MSTTEGRRGLFLTFEGTEGSGKTTQMRCLIDRLRAQGHLVLETVEPGGTSIGTQIRKILLDSTNREMAPVTELLLYFAARAQNVAELIRPALEEGKVVVSDRFTDSTMVYQGTGRDLGEQVVNELHRVACGDLQPDLTLYLDIDLETGLARAHARNRDRAGTVDETRLEEESVEFHRSVREAYLRLAAAHPGRFRVIDARLDEEAVAAAIWKAVEPLLKRLDV